jgi:hypothetical protein
MDDARTVVDLEHAGWRALATGGHEAARFYDGVLAERIVMLLPGGTVIDDRAQAVHAMSGAPWDEHDLGPELVLPLGTDGIALTYRATARRGDTVYTALFNSTYVRVDATWRLALHQQTPV